MSYDSSRDHGYAEYQNWMHLPQSAVSGIVEGDNSQPLIDRKYASFVHVINGSDLASYIKGDNYSQYIVTSGSYTYVMKAPIGSVLTDAVWQMKRIYDNGTSIQIMWADGDSNFDNIANDYGTKSFSF